MGRKMEFTRRLYDQIQRDGEAPCYHDNCKGKIKFVREREEQAYEEVSEEKTFFYRCTNNCKHRWKILKNNLCSKLIFSDY